MATSANKLRKSKRKCIVLSGVEQGGDYYRRNPNKRCDSLTDWGADSRYIIDTGNFQRITELRIQPSLIITSKETSASLPCFL